MASLEAAIVFSVGAVLVLVVSLVATVVTLLVSSVVAVVGAITSRLALGIFASGSCSSSCAHFGWVNVAGGKFSDVTTVICDLGSVTTGTSIISADVNSIVIVVGGIASVYR